MDTKTLLSARWRGWRNQLAARSGDRRVLLGLIAAVAVALLLGHLAAPDLLTPPTETATPSGIRIQARARLAAGANALEASFWLTILLGAISSFRVMELLFRRPEIRAISTLPLSTRALFLDRLVYGLLDAAALAAGASLLFLPMLWHGAVWPTITSISLLWLGMIATMGVGMGVQLFAGAQEFGTTRDAQGTSFDLYGGPGQTFLFAPGIALGMSAVVVLLLKLALGEALRLETVGRATWLGLALGLGLGAVGLATGWSYFQRGYLRMLAGFREADFVGFDLPIDYQQSDYQKTRRLEGLLPPEAARVYRRHALQYGRRYALARMSYGVLWLLYGIAAFSFSATAFPTWAAVAAPLLLLGVMTNPWSRLAAAGIATRPLQALPVDPDHERRATALYGVAEALLFSGPLALLLLITRGVKHGMWLDGTLGALAILLGSILAAAAAALAARSAPLNARTPALAAALTTIFLGASGAFALPTLTAMLR